jgi:2-oxoisovalerate dehydrogenase E2 component (dihydrolipoyl transacylase)
MNIYNIPLRRARSSLIPLTRSFAVHPFKLPDIGEGIAEVQMMEWFVKEGDRVKEMDRLCLVESDKASVEITSRYHGVVKRILAAQHEQAKVGSVIVEIDDETESTESPKETRSESSPKKADSGSAESFRATPSKSNGEAKAVPAVRALAKQMGIDLAEVQGSGKDGRITEDDVKSHKSGKPSSAPSSLPTVVKLSQVGIAMVKSMTDSLRVPMLTHSDEIECDKLYHLIKHLKPLVKEQFNLPTLTITAFLIKAVSLGIEKYPIVNSRLSDSLDSYTLQPEHNVSVAMDSPRGLVVPNIKNVERLSIIEIQRQLIALQDRAKSGRLSIDDIRGGTISLSNVGVIGGTYTKPVIFNGQSVIGAIGRMERVPKFASDNSDTVIAKRVMNISWSADHRHVDGASVARFSNVFKQVVESPEIITALHFK